MRKSKSLTSLIGKKTQKTIQSYLYIDKSKEEKGKKMQMAMVIHLRAWRTDVSLST